MEPNKWNALPSHKLPIFILPLKVYIYETGDLADATLENIWLYERHYLDCDGMVYFFTSVTTDSSQVIKPNLSVSGLIYLKK